MAFDLEEFIAKIIPPDTRDHREGFGNEVYIDKLNAKEKGVVEEALLIKLANAKHDQLIITTLAYLRSAKALPALYALHESARWGAMHNLVVLASIYEINSDDTLVDPAIKTFNRMSSMYDILFAFYYLAQFKNSKTNDVIGSFVNHKEYLIAYNAKRHWIPNMKKHHTPPTPSKRPVDLLIEEYESFHQKPANKVINYICIPAIVFAILGFVWSIPFPNLAFLGKYNGFINWASFIIAFTIYYYLKRSPILSYLMLFTYFGFTYIIIQYEKNPVLPQFCVFLFVVANVAQFIGYRIEGRKPTFNNEFKFLVTAPLWFWSRILKKFNIKY